MILRLRSVAAAASLLLLLLAPGRASAQDKEADAERLFREGQKLLEERRYGEACPKFEAAYAKDRQLGTLLNLAFCHKEAGSIWYAWLEFREAELKAADMKRNDRRDFAHERLVELEKSLPKVILDNPRKLPITDVLVEEKRVPEAEHGAAFAAEEGKRKFTFKAKGKKSATVLVPIGRSLDKPQHVPVPEMEDGEDEPPPPPATVSAPPPPPQEPPRVKVVEVEAPGSTQRTLGFVALGVAGAGLVVGGVGGVLTLTNGCANNPLHSRDASSCTADARSSADTSGLVATVGFALGGAAAIAGVVLLATAPKRDSAATARVVIRPGWAGVSGTF